MAPCIIFIDEIDTIGKSRDNRMGGNDEREQTLNQLLAELDGFDPGKGVIVLGATNRPEVLDKALLRPGRFDRRITIDRPNLAGRLATLQVHTRKIKLAEDVDLKKIALATAGTVGADLANLVNEAALRAVRHGRQAVNQEDLLASFEFVIAGSEKKNSVLTQFERRLVAYHEVGHELGEDGVFLLASGDDKLEGGQQVLLVDRPAAVADSPEGGLVHQVGQVGPYGAGGGQGDFVQVHVLAEADIPGVALEGGQAARQVGPVDGDAPVEAAGAEERLVQHLGAVGGPQNDDALAGVEAVQLGQQLVDRKSVV